MTERLSDTRLGWGLLVGGSIGWVAAFVLLLEKLRLLEDPNYTPSCSISPILNCGSVMVTEQAELLGFPNPVIGLATFPLVIATGVAVLAGATFARWYWLGLQTGATAGLALVVWLISQSLYEIGALCPYCMVVWAAVFPLWWYLTLRNLRAGVLGSRARTHALTQVASEWHAMVALLPYVVVLTLITTRFWDYWSSLL